MKLEKTNVAVIVVSVVLAGVVITSGVVIGKMQADAGTAKSTNAVLQSENAALRKQLTGAGVSVPALSSSDTKTPAASSASASTDGDVEKAKAAAAGFIQAYQDIDGKTTYQQLKDNTKRYATENEIKALFGDGDQVRSDIPFAAASGSSTVIRQNYNYDQTYKPSIVYYNPVDDATIDVLTICEVKAWNGTENFESVSLASTRVVKQNGTWLVDKAKFDVPAKGSISNYKYDE